MIELVPKTDEASKKQLAGIGSFTEHGKYPVLHLETRGGVTHWYMPDDTGKLHYFNMERLQMLWAYAWPNTGGRPKKKEPIPVQGRTLVEEQAQPTD